MVLLLKMRLPIALLLLLTLRLRIILRPRLILLLWIPLLIRSLGVCHRPNRTSPLGR
jgi:hypothetical protein